MTPKEQYEARKAGARHRGQADMTCSPESILAKVKANGISKRYILRASSAKRWEAGVYDQRLNRFIPDDELASIDVDEKMSLR